jgi:molecular chaperone DnaK
MPAVQEKVKEPTGKSRGGVNLDEVVAVGAATPACSRATSRRSPARRHLLARIETKGGVMTKLIGGTRPSRPARRRPLDRRGQPTSVEIHVLQGESEMATFNKTLGKFQLVGIPPAPRHAADRGLLDIDANGSSTSPRVDHGTGIEQQTLR